MRLENFFSPPAVPQDNHAIYRNKKQLGLRGIPKDSPRRMSSFPIQFAQPCIDLPPKLTGKSSFLTMPIRASNSVLPRINLARAGLNIPPNQIGITSTH